MKIMIVTLFGEFNYGNRLQNYALKTILEDEFNAEVISGLDVTTKEHWVNSSNGWKRVVKSLIPFFVFKKRDGKLKKDLYGKRGERFTEWSEKYTPFVDSMVVRNTRCLGKKIHEEQYDYFVAGSDQVWNPLFGEPNVFYLNFTKPQKKLSFAASISIPKLTSKQANAMKKGLMGFRNLSLREAQGAKMAEELTGRKAEVTLDPTLLAKKEKWDTIEKKPDYDVPDEYCLTYFLGDIPQKVIDYAKEKNIPLLQMNSKSDEKLNSIDPSEFVYLIHHAKCFFTDSFHGVAFSVICHTNFYVFKRKEDGAPDMFSRITNILSIFDLETRHLDRDQAINDITSIDEAKWNQCDKIRSGEREKAVKMLKDAMKDKD